jgi:hypothetical protein
MDLFQLMYMPDLADLVTLGIGVSVDRWQPWGSGIDFEDWPLSDSTE